MKDVLLNIVSKKLAAVVAAGLIVAHMAINDVDPQVIDRYLLLVAALLTGQTVLDGMKGRNGG